jgi:hypothetical protein
MNPGYIVISLILISLLGIIAYLLWNKPVSQPVIVVEKETPTWIPWSWGWAKNPGTLSISRPIPYFYEFPHHTGSHPAISIGHRRPSLPMPQTPVPPSPQPHHRHEQRQRV